MFGLAEIKKMNDVACKKAKADKRRLLKDILVVCPFCKGVFHPKEKKSGGE